MNSILRKEETTYIDRIEVDCTTNGWIVSAFLQEGEYDWITKRNVYQDDEIEDMKEYIAKLLTMSKKDT